MRVKVNEGWQLGVADGKLHYAGEEFDVPDALAAEWISTGQAAEVKKAPKVKMVAESKNKAVAPPEVENKVESKFTGTPKAEKK